MTISEADRRVLAQLEKQFERRPLRARLAHRRSDAMARCGPVASTAGVVVGVLGAVLLLAVGVIASLAMFLLALWGGWRLASYPAVRAAGRRIVERPADGTA